MSDRTSSQPKYRHYKPKNLAVVRIDGHDVYLGKYGSPESWERYGRALAESRARGQIPARADAGESAAPMTVNGLILNYWRHVQSYYVKEGKPTSEVDTIRQALRFLRRCYGGTAAREFGPNSLKVTRQAMIDHGLARTYINKQVDRIRRMFRWSAESELLPVTTYQTLLTVPGLRKGRTQAKERPPVVPVAAEVVEATLPHVQPAVAALIRVQQLTGMRAQEVTSMRLEDIDQSDSTCWIYRPGRHKSEHHEKARVVFLGPRAQAILKPFVAGTNAGGGGFIFSPRRSEESRNADRRKGRRSPMTPSQQKRRPKRSPQRSKRQSYDTTSYRRAIRRGCDLAFPHPSITMQLVLDCLPPHPVHEIPATRRTKAQRNELQKHLRTHLKTNALAVELATWQRDHAWHPHQLRHSAATEIRRRYGLEASQAVLGHSELGATQIYAEVNMNRAREIMAESG